MSWASTTTQEANEKIKEVVEVMTVTHNDLLKGQRAATKVFGHYSNFTTELTSKQLQVQHALLNAMQEVEKHIGDVAFFCRFKKMKSSDKLDLDDVVQLQHDCCASFHTLIEESKTMKALLPTNIKTE